MTPLVLGAGITAVLLLAGLWALQLRTQDAATADLGWFVSLWNPYQVQEIKTHMTFP